MEDVYVRYKTAELIWVIGGAQVYQEAMGLAHKILATEIDAEYVGDTYLPRLDNRWKPDIGNWQVSVSGLRYRFVNWCRTHDR
jgi:dihydrofolate reductase